MGLYIAKEGDLKPVNGIYQCINRFGGVLPTYSGMYTGFMNGDKIAISTNKNDKVAIFTNNKDYGTSISGTIDGSATAYYSAFPYDAIVANAKNIYTFDIPSVLQTYEDFYDRRAFIYVGYSTKLSTLSLKTANSFFWFRSSIQGYSPDVCIDEIRISVNDESEGFVVKAKIDTKTGLITESISTTKEMIYKGPIYCKKIYYLPIMPVSLAHGYTIRCITNNGKEYLIVKEGPYVLSRNSIKTLNLDIPELYLQGINNIYTLKDSELKQIKV